MAMPTPSPNFLSKPQPDFETSPSHFLDVPIPMPIPSSIPSPHFLSGGPQADFGSGTYPADGLPPITTPSDFQPERTASPSTTHSDGELGSDDGSEGESLRTIVCCFDGTGNKPGQGSNVLLFFRALMREDDKEDQVVYYQPGIGAYASDPQGGIYSSLVSTAYSALDEGTGMSINLHIKEGYKFIMENYRKKNKICLFGFSRGAHVARLLSLMLYKVGVLHSQHKWLVDYAFSISQIPGRDGRMQSKLFRETFSRPATVQFLGVWDTVASIGLTRPILPPGSLTYAVKEFRQALALDERRARFRPELWGQPILDCEQDFDFDHQLETDVDIQRLKGFTPLDRDHANVKEVWFAGCHSDIGGGSGSDLAFIPLRWMIRECIQSDAGIIFDDDMLFKLGFNPEEPVEANLNTTYFDTNDSEDAPIDELDRIKWWWLIELLPTHHLSRDSDGHWYFQRELNIGYGRFVPFDDEGKIKIHSSVRTKLGRGYQPAAWNWDDVQELINSGSNRVQWVD
ncbi:hypothetical protein BDN72DRAFT_900199 [Pluteus cervinus]|uniref:Uncharacterized protein n=1 Tax=Pluteus cervinus TaxID=181527 RepID=A0ACD3AJS2_9AGAR|nr:hypothetical protein BDN72DRAFT_900199 [Pluteus cervinus]